MQKDMHFYMTFAMAVASGIPEEDAQTIAYSAQYVDDSTVKNSEHHQDGGSIFSIATAHHALDCIKNAHIQEDEQKRVWIPFHFLPGGAGETLEEKLLCVKDSTIAKDMMHNHIKQSRHAPYRLQLMGIAAHVFSDTFSHYGFSGISSKFNEVDGSSFEFVTTLSDDLNQYITEKKDSFLNKFKNQAFSYFANISTRGLGHGAVATLPDRPYLHWKCRYEKDRSNDGKISDRDNPTTFLEATEKLYAYFEKFASMIYAEIQPTPYPSIQTRVQEILNYQGKLEERCQQWQKAIEEGVFGTVKIQPHYDPMLWEDQKNKEFQELNDSSLAIDMPVYRFHQASFYHRFHVLKELLPQYGIVVY